MMEKYWFTLDFVNFRDIINYTLRIYETILYPFLLHNHIVGTDGNRSFIFFKFFEGSHGIQPQKNQKKL